ncbi:MAG: hypothetical protein AAGA33_02440 [Pseudomonadota bacterium]
MLTVTDVGLDALRELARRYALEVSCVSDNGKIPGSFWGEPEAGLIESTVYVRGDTPVHSFLHELCHVLCMDDDRRKGLHTNAGGDDLEESAVCYLQVVLSDHLPGVGRNRLMQDMDSWGYSFRLGSTAAWFQDDATDARDWLTARQLLPEV